MRFQVDLRLGTLIPHVNQSASQWSEHPQIWFQVNPRLGTPTILNLIEE